MLQITKLISYLTLPCNFILQIFSFDENNDGVITKEEMIR